MCRPQGALLELGVARIGPNRGTPVSESINLYLVAVQHSTDHEASWACRVCCGLPKMRSNPHVD